MRNTVLILLTVSVVFFAVSLSSASADILPPKKQISFGISADDVVCESGMFKIIKDRTNTVSCVNAKHVSKLVSYGWAKSVDKSKLNSLISELNVSTGTINQLIITPISSTFGKETPKVSVGSYDFVFDVCASTQTLVSPSILVRSDSETKHYELPETVFANSCVTSAIVIKASNTKS